MLFTSPKPPLTYFGLSIQFCSTCIAALISDELNLMSCDTHLSYPSPPSWRRTISSSQSVAGQPVAVPDPMPPHHGFLPAAAIVSLSAIISSHVVGTFHPAAENAF